MQIIIEKYFFIILAILFISGCGHAVDDVSEPPPEETENLPTVTAVLSDQLQKLSNPTETVQTLSRGKLQAYLQIDSGEAQVMALSGDNLQFSLSLSGLDKTILHELKVSVNYSLDNNPDRPITVAQATKKDHDFSNEFKLTFSASDFTTDFDQDSDGMTNLAELLVGGNPFNQAPTIISSNSVIIEEDQTLVVTVKAIAPVPDAVLTYSVTGGADQAKFSIDKNNGELSFISAPIYEVPMQSLANLYEVQVTVSDGSLNLSQNITVQVTDIFNLQLTVGFKNLQFRWTPYEGAAYYKIKEIINGVSKDLKYSSGSPNIEDLQFNQEISVHLFDQANTRYVLETYNSGNALLKDSAEISINGSMANAIGYIKPNEATGAHSFGENLTLSADGKTLVVSAIDGLNPTTPNAGSLYVYSRGSDGLWPPQGVKLEAEVPTSYHQFGLIHSLSADGGTLVVGAPYEDSADQTYAGVVYVFTRDANGTWPSLGVKLEANDPAANNYFGSKLTLSGDGRQLVVAAPYANAESGAVYHFSLNDLGVWQFRSKLQPSDLSAGDRFGDQLSTSYNGKLLVVAAPYADIGSFADAGAVYIFDAIAIGGWYTAGKKRQADDANQDDLFGKRFSLSLDGNTLAVVSPNADVDGFVNAGAVYIFSREVNSNWPMLGIKLKSNTPGANFEFGGTSVEPSGQGVHLSNNGQTLVVIEFNSTFFGLAYVFTRDANGEWPPLGVKLEVVSSLNKLTNPAFGRSSSLSSDGSILAVGAYLMGYDNKSTSQGAVFMFSRSLDGNWATQGTELRADFPGAGDWFGYRVSLSEDGKALAIGAVGASTVYMY